MARPDVIPELVRHGFVGTHEESKRKHLVLLIALVVAIVAQPWFAGRSGVGDAAMTLVLGAVYLCVIFAVFGEGRRRRIAYCLFVPALAMALAHDVLPRGLQGVNTVLMHCVILALLGYGVMVILRGLFARTAVSVDDVLGTVCGYLLVALAWAHLYDLAYMIRPDAFSIAPSIAGQLDDPHLRNALFNYFSLTTLMTIGFGDVTPVGPPVYSLVWLEVLFGQFYMAVVVAQLVGLKLAQVIARNQQRSGS
jgi:hypothetical protein